MGWIRLTGLVTAGLACASCSWGTRIENAWVITPPAGSDALAYFEIEARSGGTILASAKGPFAKAEFHMLTAGQDVIGPIRLASGEKMAFRPGGSYVRLIGLHSGIGPGDVISLQFFEDEGGTIEASRPVSAILVAPGARPPY